MKANDIIVLRNSDEDLEVFGERPIRASKPNGSPATHQIRVHVEVHEQSTLKMSPRPYKNLAFMFYTCRKT